MQLLQMFYHSGVARASRRPLKRRHRLVVSAVAAMTAISLSACAQSENDSRSVRRAISQSQAIATDFLRTELALSPETASRLDLERFLGPTAIYSFDNHSQAGFERRRLVRIELLQRLQQRPRLPDGHPLARDLAVAETALIDLIALEQLGYGRFSYAAYRPYAMDAYSGIWIEGPAQLAYRQSVNNADQATAFIARLRALSEAVQDTRRRLIADRAAGIIMPRSLAEESHLRLQQLIDPDSAALTHIVVSFDALTLDVDDLDETQREQLSALVSRELETNLRPALQDLSETMSDLSREASDQSGIWAQPKGQDLFTGILKAATGDPLSTDRLHARHLTEVENRRAALISGLSLSEALAETAPPRPDALRDSLIWFETLMAVPEDEAASPAEPVSRRDVLRELAPSSTWTLIADDPAFAAQRDAVSAYAALWASQPYLTWRTEGDGELTPYRQIVEYPAIRAAWHLYAWERQRPAADPVARAAHATIALVQTTLAAADTGLHLDRWTLDQATDYISSNTGLDAATARQLALRIIARPGHHSSVLAAFHRFEALSERAQAVLGERYAETDFQRTLIQAGPRPLSFIETDIEAWYGARLAN